MGLELSDIRAPYRDFRTDEATKYVQQMPLLIADSRVPINVAGVFERRLNAGRTQPQWNDNYVFTGDAFALSAADSDKFKVVRKASFLKGVNEKTRLLNGALVLGDGIYAGIESQEFSRRKLGDRLNYDLTAEDVKEHEVWLEIVGNRDELVKYVDRKFPEMKARFNYDKAMGIYLSDAQNVDTARALAVYRLVNRSRVGGRGDLGCGDARLVGIAPEALEALILEPSLDHAIRVVNAYSGEVVIVRKPAIQN